MEVYKNSDVNEKKTVVVLIENLLRSFFLGAQLWLSFFFFWRLICYIFVLGLGIVRFFF